MKLPSTLAEITAIASIIFKDPAAVTVNIETAWGIEVTVNRDLEVKAEA
jgi:hypothetical protein